MQVGVGRNRDSEPIYQFIVCYQRRDRQVLSTRRRRMWQVVTLIAGISLVGLSGRVC